MKENNDSFREGDSLKAVKGIMFGLIIVSVIWTILIMYLLR